MASLHTRAPTIKSSSTDDNQIVSFSGNRNMETWQTRSTGYFYIKIQKLHNEWECGACVIDTFVFVFSSNYVLPFFIIKSAAHAMPFSCHRHNKILERIDKKKNQIRFLREKKERKSSCSQKKKWIGECAEPAHSLRHRPPELIQFIFLFPFTPWMFAQNSQSFFLFSHPLVMVEAKRRKLSSSKWSLALQKFNK